MTKQRLFPQVVHSLTRRKNLQTQYTCSAGALAAGKKHSTKRKEFVSKERENGVRVRVREAIALHVSFPSR